MAYGKITADRQWFRAFFCFGFGFLLFVIAAILYAFAIYAASQAEDASAAEGIGRIVGLIGTFFIFGGFLQLFNGVRCLKSRSAHQLTLTDLDNDARPPVLYLRPFTIDNAVLSSGARVFNPLNLFSYYKLRQTVFGGWSSYLKLRWTFEQVLEFATRKMGPLVAIGQPGSPPVMGAHNLFVGEEWQERVAELEQHAQLVVLAAGATTPGVLWEVEFTRTRLDPKKFLIFVPGGKYRWWWPFWRTGSRRKTWAAFRKASEKLFPVSLPEKLRGAAFVAFDSDWQPSLLDPGWRRPPTSEARDYLAWRVMKII
jgi:hypothetical protein